MDSIDVDKAKECLVKVRQLIVQNDVVGATFSKELSAIAPERVLSGRNLLTCLLLHTEDHALLVKNLRDLGLDISRSEAAAMATLRQLEALLMRLVGDEAPVRSEAPFISAVAAADTLKRNREAIYGIPQNGRATSIMVTLDPPAASVEMLKDLLESGADAFRINTAHDDPESWRGTIQR